MGIPTKRRHSECRFGIRQQYRSMASPLIGDKGFMSGDLKLEAAAHEIDLQTPLRKNMPDGRDPAPLPV